jgi:hypothetical protein
LSAAYYPVPARLQYGLQYYFRLQKAYERLSPT